MNLIERSKSRHCVLGLKRKYRRIIAACAAIRREGGMALGHVSKKRFCKPPFAQRCRCPPEEGRVPTSASFLHWRYSTAFQPDALSPSRQAEC